MITCCLLSVRVRTIPNNIDHFYQNYYNFQFSLSFSLGSFSSLTRWTEYSLSFTLIVSELMFRNHQKYHKRIISVFAYKCAATHAQQNGLIFYFSRIIESHFLFRQIKNGFNNAIVIVSVLRAPSMWMTVSNHMLFLVDIPFLFSSAAWQPPFERWFNKSNKEEEEEDERKKI